MAEYDPKVIRRLSMMAAALIAAAHPDDLNLHNSLYKAQTRLNNNWSFEPGGLAGIASDSRPGIRYVTDGSKCECAARTRWCWHRAAWLILFTLATVCGMEPDEQGTITIAFPPVMTEGTKHYPLLTWLNEEDL